MRNIRPERTVTVNVSDLLNKMKTNRIEHQHIYDEAMTGYRRKCVEQLEKRLAQARKAEEEEGDPISLGFSLRQPVSYVEQYDTIIEMLEWSTEQTVELTMGEFNAWVRDRWDFQKSFLESNSAYSMSATRKLADF
jgi:hypothetical protein